MEQSELNAIAFRCSQLGAKGYIVRAIILPTSATQCNPVYVTEKPNVQSATERCWYDD